MFSTSNNKIKLTRGDTAIAVLTLLDAEGNPYVPEQGDSIRFALKHPTMNADQTEYTDTEPLLIKTIPTDTLTLHIEPDDTKDLGFGTYVYDVEITHANDMVDTFICEARFELKPEVH